MRTARIYIFTSKTTGRSYVGQTWSTMSRRYANHKSSTKRSGYNSVFVNAMRKYGISDFDFFCLEDNILTQPELDESEQFWIQYLETKTPNGYNIKPGGDSRGQMRQETKDRISASSKRTPEQRAMISQRMKGHKYSVGRRHTEEAKAKMRSSAMGRYARSEAWRANASLRMKLRWDSLTDKEHAMMVSKMQAKMRLRLSEASGSEI